ncbi:hypothetical protein TNCT_353311 [Trichonephila clavata]|uniref:Uncharacterized protein n=1 Tax=Trichonephila clavata TaxID=2740835 RepID=A0A8X6FZ01_TRICU|nr:hypothetical protein TNCT_353311 [Trichonephila clavata]
MPANKDGSCRLMPRRFRGKGKLIMLQEHDRRERLLQQLSDSNNQDIKKKRNSESSNIYVHFNLNASTSEPFTENKKPGTEGTTLQSHSARNDDGTSEMNAAKEKGLRTCCSAYDNSPICLSGNSTLINKYGHLIREICLEMYAFM